MDLYPCEEQHSKVYGDWSGLRELTIRTSQHEHEVGSKYLGSPSCCECSLVNQAPLEHYLRPWRLRGHCHCG